MKHLTIESFVNSLPEEDLWKIIEDYEMMIDDDEFGAPFLRQKAREFSDMYFYRDYMPKIALYAYRHFALKYKETQND
jgi:hypothetical protein